MATTNLFSILYFLWVSSKDHGMKEDIHAMQLLYVCFWLNFLKNSWFAVN